MGKLTDLSGNRFGKWTVIKRDLSIKRPAKYFCKCECGEVCSVLAGNLRRNLSTQCMKCASISRSQNLVGMRFGNALIISIQKHEGIAKAEVQCDCGQKVFISPCRLKSGIYKSCGKCNLSRKNTKDIHRKFTIGKKFGFLEIIERIDPKTMKAKCKCGNLIEVKYHHLKTMFPSCGCYWRNKNIEKAKKLVGFKIGYLKVVDFLGMKKKNGKSRANYLLKCKCGKKFEKSIAYLFASKSCGCLQKEKALKGSRQGNSVLKEFEVTAMRQLFKSKLYNAKELAEIFGISYEHCCKIIKKKCWNHID